MNETFGQMLQRRRLELGHERGKRMKQDDMIAHLETRIANPLLKISPSKLSVWENGHCLPAPEVQTQVCKALGVEQKSNKEGE